MSIAGILALQLRNGLLVEPSRKQSTCTSQTGLIRNRGLSIRMSRMTGFNPLAR
jgi:hypothetical protein